MTPDTRIAPPIPQRLLAVKIGDIGDLICVTPALRALRETFPTAQIDILTTPHAAPILAHTGLVDTIIPFTVRGWEAARDLLKPSSQRALWTLAGDLRRRRYDTTITFHQLSTRFGALKHAFIQRAVGARVRVGLDNGRGWFFSHRVTDGGFGARHQVGYWLALAEVLGAHTANHHLTVGISALERAWAEETLPAGKTYAAIHPGSGGLNPARRWDAAKFAEVADYLHRQRGHTVMVVGGKGDDAESVLEGMETRDIAVNLVGRTTLNQLAALLERCTLFVGGDSGVMHLAAAIPGLQVISPFGATNAEAWRAWSESAVILRSPSLCSPCGYVHHTAGLRTGCAARTCMKAIPTAAVIAAMEGNAPPRQTAPPEVGAANRFRVLGIPLDPITFEELFSRIGTWIGDGLPRPRMIATANPELVMIAQRDSLFFDILNRADLVTADGVGLLWAGRRLGTALPERVTGSDGLPLISERAAREGWRLYLLGAAPGVAEKVATVFQDRYPGLQIVGTHSGTPSAEDEDTLVAGINAAGADILFLAYGSPAQEKWIARNLPRLEVRVVIGVGGAFDFAAGVAKRAPRWAQRAGMEWLHRLVMQPWRWRRMLRLPRFALAVLRRGSRPPFGFHD
ncbi:MAG TPA: WecB/TagA/CpsF family glycosyltransferase [Aggregatilineales bacterium]|nr:WecB/TagA/CpsF family glycosyltransferase [Anaerolineales bacterium]HRE47143.1 WecB/TagA/CpsF family glycosyltransferase [Aggregatilineales bacterium]